MIEAMDGIIVGSDQTLEWTLPWWWDHYRRWNSFPVVFIDFGLSLEKKRWCEERGERKVLRVVDFAEEVDAATAQEWEREFGTQFWESRNAWFKKPMACSLSPFKRTLWIDLDCEIRGSLAPLFEYADRNTGFAMAKEQIDVPKTHPIYNSGVIAFRQNHPLLKEWGERCLKESRLFRGDQEVLSALIAEKKIEIDEIPPLYNWSRCLEERADILIHHWHGAYGKEAIRSAVRAMSSPSRIPSL